ncbi:hypothetical protein PVMG_05113 [Plasmodium vivax Mauritania I]|uniref:Variable surface protein Vir18 n=1 Tax=Plasmodium vivax Mauritania I TaxID=1035515 RepID=A0A0J9THR9_PLAVI|nr:hypothetical protein PVMG_05113 [Plasmodium vivax Mauritania I]
MDWLFKRPNVLSNLYKKYNDGPCMNNYANIKSDILQRIDNFEKTPHARFYQEWDQLNKYIIEKDKELSECYKKGYVNSKLNDDDTIKNFKSRCNRDRTCNNRATAATKPTITKVPAQRTCKGSKGCKNESPPTVDIKSKSKLSSGAANPQSSERNVSQEQGQNQADGQKPRQERVVLQPQTSIMPSGISVGTHDEAFQKIVNHHSTTSGMVETQKQQLNVSVPSVISELGSPPSDHSSHCVSRKTSDLTCTPLRKNLDAKDIQNNQHNGNPLDTNQPGSQDSVSEIVAQGTGDNQDIIRETAPNLSPTESTPHSVQRGDEDSLPTTTDRGSTSTVASDRENTGTEEDSSAYLDSSPSSDAGTKGVTDVDTSKYVGAPDGESKSVKDYHDHPPGSEHSCTEPHCRAEQVGELTDDQSDIFGKVINAIQRNPQIIKTSMPIGIALLLGLLFKYTPLWRVLTKKNRKKGASINEELNSVLQEPSIMDDERSIPFSYDAFEYSTFDQNSY